MKLNLPCVAMSFMLTLLTFTNPTFAEFTYTNIPTEMTIGQTYNISWTGALGDIDMYLKKDASASSWRAYLYGGMLWFFPCRCDLVHPGTSNLVYSN